MTTIAASVKHGSMASDSKCVFGDIHFPVTKIFRLPDGSLLGTAGASTYTIPFETAMREGRVYAPTESPNGEADFAALRLSKDGLYMYDSSFAAEKVLHGVCAVGTGNMIALSYLLDGASPSLAVEKACRVDNNSGLPVQSKKIKSTR